jgi:hypothetical protein
MPDSQAVAPEPTRARRPMSLLVADEPKIVTVQVLALDDAHADFG